MTQMPDPIASGSGTRRTPSDAASSALQTSASPGAADASLSDEEGPTVPQSPEEHHFDEDDSDGLSYVDPDEFTVRDQVDDASDEDDSQSDSGSGSGPLVLEADLRTVTFSTS
jgi:hypothetical protein